MKNEKLTEWELKAAKEMKRALIKNQRNRVLVYIKSVSRSGLSRCLRFTFLDSYGDPLNMDSIVAKVTGERNTDKGVFVKGCGMDMIFSTLNCFLIGMGVDPKEAHFFACNYKQI